MDKFILISDTKWEKDYKPVMEKVGGQTQTRYFYTVDEVQEYIKPLGYDAYNVWTCVDGDDGVVDGADGASEEATTDSLSITVNGGPITIDCEDEM